MPSFRFLASGLATCLALVATSCWAAPCTGQTPQHHPTDPFAFDTNSHVEYKPRLHLDVCIHNPDPKYYLRFAWFVPDWAGFAPPANGIEGRHFPADPKAAPVVLNSCIEYGNAGSLTTADFLGDADEKQAADLEDKSACKPPAPVKTASVSDLEPIDYAFHLFFPSENGNAEATMLAFDAKYVLKPEGSGYSSTVDYRLSRAPDRPEGDPKAIVMRPLLTGAAEGLTKFLYSQNSSGTIHLGEEGNPVLFQVKEGRGWKFAHATLQFLDRSGVQVARAEIPVFVPAQ
jgi:hypothetical protein